MTRPPDAAPLGTVAPTDLGRARRELHWAAQIPAAAAHSILPPRDDDGQSNFGWSAPLGALETRELPGGVRVALEVGALTLTITRDGQAASQRRLAGARLAELVRWLEDELRALGAVDASTTIALRDYDMPGHPVAAGAPFGATDEDAHGELARWYEAAFRAVGDAAEEEEHATEARCWPHHFDVGALVLLDPEEGAESGRSIGLGWSPGDDSIDAPYFYANPYPAPDPWPADEPEGGGELVREPFHGSILRGERIVESASLDAQLERVDAYLRSTVAIWKSALAG